MNAFGVPPAPKPWPPLRVAETSGWIKFRDVALTLIAWVVLAWLLRDLVFLLFDYLSYPVFKITRTPPADFVGLWTKVRIITALSVLLAGGLLIWAIKDRHRLRAKKPTTVPTALSLAEQAAWFNMDAESVAAARNFKVTDVQFREDGTVSAFSGRVAKAPVEG